MYIMGVYVAAALHFPQDRKKLRVLKTYNIMIISEHHYYGRPSLEFNTLLITSSAVSGRHSRRHHSRSFSMLSPKIDSCSCGKQFPNRALFTVQLRVIIALSSAEFVVTLSYIYGYRYYVNRVCDI